MRLGNLGARSGLVSNSDRKRPAKCDQRGSQPAAPGAGVGMVPASRELYLASHPFFSFASRMTAESWLALQILEAADTIDEIRGQAQTKGPVPSW